MEEGGENSGVPSVGAEGSKTLDKKTQIRCMLLSIAARIGTVVSTDNTMAHYPCENVLLMQVLGLLLIGVAGGTIGIITNNDALELVRDLDRDTLTSAGKELRDLTNLSLGAAVWLIVLNVGIIIAEIIAAILVPVITKFQVLQVVMQIIVSIFVLLQELKSIITTFLFAGHTIQYRSCTLLWCYWHLMCSIRRSMEKTARVVRRQRV